MGSIQLKPLQIAGVETAYRRTVVQEPSNSYPSNCSGSSKLTAFERQSHWLQEIQYGTGNHGYGRLWEPHMICFRPIPSIIKLCPKNDRPDHGVSVFGSHWTITERTEFSTKLKPCLKVILVIHPCPSSYNGTHWLSTDFQHPKLFQNQLDWLHDWTKPSQNSDLGTNGMVQLSPSSIPLGTSVSLECRNFLMNSNTSLFSSVIYHENPTPQKLELSSWSIGSWLFDIRLVLRFILYGL